MMTGECLQRNSHSFIVDDVILHVEYDLDGMYWLYHKNNNKLTGEFIRWYDNNMLEKQIFYKDDKHNGECKKWNKIGQLIKRQIYSNKRLVKK